MANSTAQRSLSPVRLVAAMALIGAIIIAIAERGRSAEFDVSRHSVPVRRIVSGGPPKDGIPALLTPRFVEAVEATFLRDDDRVVGVHEGATAKAYPLSILNWHEVVNDQIGERPVVVTYCPLTGSAVVFDREVDSAVLTFGVSGRLYESNVLLYDHQTESLWSQLHARAVTGPKTERALTAIPAVETTWGRWRRLHPDTRVLSVETGHRRDYNRNPYAEYESAPGTMFSTQAVDTRVFVKERVLGIVVDGIARAYPLRHLGTLAGPLHDHVGGADVTIRFDAETRSAEAFVDGRQLPAVVAYWFAWSAFHPGTELWSGGRPRAEASARMKDVEVASVDGYWSSMLGLVGDDPAESRPTPTSIYVVSGKLHNVSARLIHHVQLRFELLDAAGTVVHREVGFNRSAEVLRAAPTGKHDAPAVEPIAPGGTDSFRMLFFGDELPEFADMRVEVLAVE
jgi:hypothetical protein